MEEQLKIENQLCFPLYAASKKIISKYTPILKPFDLTYTQYITLLVLYEYGDTNVNDLGKHLLLDSGTLSPLLKKLEAKNLIKRTRERKDERNVIISLTKKSKDLEKELANVPYQIGGCIKLEKEEALTLYRTLYKIIEQ